MNSSESLGLLETKTLISAAYAADAMLSASKVKLIAKKEIPERGVTIAVRGDADSINSAVSAGIAASKRLGEYIDSRVIPEPHPALIQLIQEEK